MLCTAGHKNLATAKFCELCGVSSFVTNGTSQPTPLAVTSTNGYAVASMVLGIVWIFWIGSALALIFGIIAKGQIRETGQLGSGMATAGIVLGLVGATTLLLAMLSGGFHFYVHFN